MMMPPRQVHKYLSYWCVSHDIGYRDKTRMRRIDKKSLKIPMGLSEDTTNGLVRRYHQWACQKIPMGLSEDTTNGLVRRYHQWACQKIPPMGLSEDTTNGPVRRYHQWACQKIPPMGVSEAVNRRTEKKKYKQLFTKHYCT